MLSCSLSPDKGSFYKIQMNLDEKCGLVRKHEIEKKTQKGKTEIIIMQNLRKKTHETRKRSS